MKSYREMSREELLQLKAELERLRDEQELPYVKEEYEDLVRFVEKNQELIQCESPWSRDDAFGLRTSTADGTIRKR